MNSIQILSRRSPILLAVPIVLPLLVVALVALPCGASNRPSAAGTPLRSQTESPQAPTKTVSQAITQPLSPTALNVFNFGNHKFKVQYPAGSRFSGVEMTVTAVDISQEAFSQRVLNTAFAKSLCVVYTGELGNCIDYQVTCTNTARQAIKCPTTTSGYILFWSTYDTGQPIVNPGFLTTPIGANTWQNVLDSFYLTQADPTAHGHTKGWSEFVSVAVGVTVSEGLGEFSFNAPLLALDPKSFAAGETIPVSFHLASDIHCANPINDASASVSVLMVANGLGTAVSEMIYSKQNAFTYVNGNYEFALPTKSFPAGTYVLTVYGNAFVTQETYFTIQ